MTRVASHRCRLNDKTRIPCRCIQMHPPIQILTIQVFIPFSVHIIIEKYGKTFTKLDKDVYTSCGKCASTDWAGFASRAEARVSAAVSKERRTRLGVTPETRREGEPTPPPSFLSWTVCRGSAGPAVSLVNSPL